MHGKCPIAGGQSKFSYNLGEHFKPMKLTDTKLVRSLQLAYSAEKAAAFAYIGHANSLKDPGERAMVNQIEQDEWDHRHNVLAIMRQYGIPVSKYLELKFHIIGKLISLACHLIGRFMPYFFAGKLESGNVCEYFVMIQRFHAPGITAHDAVLHEMGVTEKEHEVYFLQVIHDEPWLPMFEKFFHWGPSKSFNDLPMIVGEELPDPEKV